MKVPQQMYSIAWIKGPKAPTPTELCPALEHVPMVYQADPIDDKGRPILPHVYGELVQVGRAWSDAAADAPAKLAAYIARTVTLGPSKMLGLNMESIPLDTAPAAAFWTRAIAAIRSAMPGVRIGFYDSPHLGALVDWFGVCLYPNKRIEFAGPCRGEHWQTPDDYRLVASAHAAAFEDAARKHFRPMFAFASLRTDGDTGDAPGYLGVLGLDAQLALATEIGADVIWWDSVGDGKVQRRTKGYLEWLADCREVSRAFNYDDTSARVLQSRHYPG